MDTETIAFYQTEEYSKGYEDGWRGNCPNPQYEDSDLYMQGYDTGFDERRDQYRY